jgi:hypothetical protein
MKSRNKEVNIFNMSLLDILCGALGTFAFMMIVLFPYYSVGKNSANQAPEVPPGVDPKTFEEAKARIQQLEDTLKKFQDYAKQLEGQVNQLTAQSKQMQQQAAKTGDKMDQMEMRNPFVAQLNFVQTQPGDQAEIYIYDTRSSTDNKIHTPKPDVTKLQGVYWPGDLQVFGPYNSYFMVRDTPGGEYHVFLKVIKHDTSAGPFLATGSINSTTEFKPMPLFRVSEAQAAVEVAKVTVLYDSKNEKMPYTQKIEITVPKDRLMEQPKPEEQKEKQKDQPQK